MPAICKPDNLDREAIELNKASEDALPMTFVDYAELVWKRLNDGQTQQAVADAIGWSRAQVSQYAMLQKIDEEAWKVVATAFYSAVANDEIDDVAGNATTVANPFSENLLRNILDLTAPQQLDLCQKLAMGGVGRKSRNTPCFRRSMKKPGRLLLPDFLDR